MEKVVLAVGAHPDDIEFMMSGTLMLLREAGYALHYMTLANGSCGTAELSHNEIVRIRTTEARAAARSIGADYHAPLANDLEIVYSVELLRRAAAVVRIVNPAILLTHSPVDYMEDHVNTARLMVSAVFSRGMRNFATQPPLAPIESEVAVYHAMPYGLCDALRQPVPAHLHVDVSSVLEKKVRMLCHHGSQKDWLDRSQGIGSYEQSLRAMATEMGRQSGVFEYAEGWRRHAHLGFAATADFDPLAAALGAGVLAGPADQGRQG